MQTRWDDELFIFCTGKTQSKIMDTSLSQSVSKILTAYWSKKTYFRPGARKTEIHSFPTMYIMGGGSFGGNGSK